LIAHERSPFDAKTCCRGALENKRMIGLLQRVSAATVTVAGETIGQIGEGLLVLTAVEPDDSRQSADRLLEKLLNYRVFADAQARMNLSLRDVKGGLLLVPQFTLAADTSKGTRASFSSAASPELGKALFEYLVAKARASYVPVSTGRFGTHMQVSLVNDGPVTLWLRAR
jgi:D-aminoacyl-tRNA deacylase